MTTTRQLLAVTLMAGVLSISSAGAGELIAPRIDTIHHTLRLERIASGLTHPWASAELPDGRWLVTERPGRLARIDTDGAVTRLSGVPEVSARGQGGLLDIALHPDYGLGDGAHDWVYFTWSQPGEGGTATTLSRGRLEGNALVDVEQLFVQNRFSTPGRHYGSRIAWRPDGTLLMSVGERGMNPKRAQDGRDHAGSFLRLDAEGEAPSDNPFVDDPTMLDELFTLGNRNPQGLTVAADGTAWFTEHGPRTGDELNRLEAGVNYGWPEVTLGRDYATNLPIGRNSAPGMRDPVYVFEGRFAPSGLAAVNGEAFPAWRGHLLAGGLASERLVRLALDGDRVIEHEVVLDGEIGRIRDIRLGRDGMLYLLNDEDPGGLFRLSPADRQAP